MIELITVIIVLAILGFSTFRFLDKAIEIYTIISKQRMIAQEASYIMERLTREMRDMINVTACDGSTIYNNSFTFIKRHKTLEGVENISVKFERSSNIMYRNSIVLGNNVSTFIVQRGRIGINTDICDCPFYITLVMTKDDQSLTLNSMVVPKNLGSSNFTGRCFNGDYEDTIR